LKKNNSNNKRKAVEVKKVYRKVEAPRLMLTSSADGHDEVPMAQGEEVVETVLGGSSGGVEEEPDPKKKRPTPTSSEDLAAAAGQPCRPQ
jgi:hypothetical protein